MTQRDPRFDPYAPPANPNPWAQPPPGYGPHGPYHPPYGHFQPTPQASSKATTALILAVVGWMACGVLTTIPALVMARGEIAAIDRGESSPAGRQLAQAAFWISLVNIVVYTLLIGYVIWVFAAVSSGARF